MNKTTAFEQAKSIWPTKRPTRASMFGHTDDGKGVMVCCHDVVLVVYNSTERSG